MQEAVEASAIDAVDDGRLGGYQARVIAMCAAIALLDGFDTQAIGFVAPAIAAEWHEPLAAFGMVFAIGLAGGLLGAILFGAVADRFGRRATILATVAIFAGGTLLTATAGTLGALGVYRFVTGLGLGGAMPSIIALASEYAPRRHRATLVVAMFCGFPLGAVIGALLSAPAIQACGWQSLFVAGGLIPLLLCLLIAWQLPESFDWLIARGRREQAARIVERMGKGALPADLSAPVRPAGSSLVSLFTEGRAIGSLLLAAIFFVSLLLVYLLVSWVPAIAVMAGHSVSAGVLAAGMLNFTGIGGALAIAAASDRLGPFHSVGTAYAIGAVAIALVALTLPADRAVFVFCALAGLFCIGAQMGAVSIASQFYPIALRGTGVGWSMAMGRLGAIAGPLIGAAMIGSGSPGPALFQSTAILSAVAAIGILLMGLAYRSRR